MVGSVDVLVDCSSNLLIKWIELLIDLVNFPKANLCIFRPRKFPNRKGKERDVSL
jgi:hypothetical protein